MSDKKTLFIKLRNGNDFVITCSSYEIKPFFYYDDSHQLVHIGNNLILFGVVNPQPIDDDSLIMLEISMNDIIIYGENINKVVSKYE